MRRPRRRCCGCRGDEPPVRGWRRCGWCLHTLRHTAVLWLETGVHIRAVADLLGHSSVSITGDIYGHTSDESARAAINGLAGRLGL